ncbi:MAG: CHASE domain-containing protein, partial [Chloroflexi bacterium]|nr:CHASE domain-containing protein [Chloroflexota bacterium]
MATLAGIRPAFLRTRPRITPRTGERFTARLPVLAGGATLAMLLAMTIGTTVALRTLMAEKSQGRFDEFAANAASSLSAEAARSLTEISAVEGLFSATRDVTQGEFTGFAIPITRSGSAVKALGFARLQVNSAGEADPEQAVGGTSESYPVTYLYPQRSGGVSIGSDLGLDARFTQAMSRARETGTAAATGPLEVPGDGTGFLVFAPVYGRTSSLEGVELVGHAFGVYDVSEFLAEPLNRAGLGTIAHRVLDKSPDGSLREISPAPGGNSSVVWGPGYRASANLTVAGREWTLEFLSPHDYGLSPLERQVWVIVMSAGIALTVVAAGSTYSLVASRRQVRDDLELLTTQLGVVLDAALEGILITDRRGRVVWANGAFSKAFGLGSAGRLNGMPWQELWKLPEVEIASRDRFAARMAEISASEVLAVSNEDVEVTRPARRTFSLTSVPVADHAGTYLGRLWVYRDVTAERAADRAKSTFVSMVSHELRTPLTSVVGFLDLALDELGAGTNGKLPKYLGTARTNAERLQRLVRDILELSSLEAGGLTLDPGPVRVNEVVTEVVESMSSQIDERALKLHTDVPESLPPARADRGRLAQILTNLLSNAVRYTAAGGKVSVVARHTEKTIELAVADTGVGIPKEYHSRIFERFVRVEGSSLRPATGSTGLGLAITKTLVDLHGGSISVAS